jgi:serine/threonine protein kinase
MSLRAGARLGPYEIIGSLGAGGMGEVYRARDTRLDRIVALKVSHEQFSARVEREARAIAALNHSHICHLYDIGPNYLVMEYLEGTTDATTESSRHAVGWRPVQALAPGAQPCGTSSRIVELPSS